MQNNISLWGVKQNNLKNINVEIPLGSFTVICGPSGSGKSSLAFQTLFAEGQRRFVESLSHYARQFLNTAPKPEIEGIKNIPPTIALEQKNSVKNSRSTVGTTTEIIDYLRLLYDKLAINYCPTHHIPTEKETVTEATQKILKQFKNERGYILVEISASGRIAEGKQLHQLLIQDSYFRIFVPEVKVKLKNKKKELVKSNTDSLDFTKGEILEINNPAAIKKGLPKDLFYLVIDRLQFTEDEKGRIADSMSQAYEASIKYNKHITSKQATVITTEGKHLKVSEDECCAICGYLPLKRTTKLFSFNSPYGACPTCKGFGNILTLDEKKVVPNPKLSIKDGTLQPFSMPSAKEDNKQLIKFCKKQNIDIETPWEDLTSDQKNKVWKGSKEFMGVEGLFSMLEEIKYKMHVRVFISRYRSPMKCPDCKGSRLRNEINWILFRNKSIIELSSMTIQELNQFLEDIKLSKNENEVAQEIFLQLKTRLNFLLKVGVIYLTLDRETRTLSGGEFQRLLLAHQLGMSLSETLYILDEPTVGLHPRDNLRLISILKSLNELGNTVVVVEHDKDVIKNSTNIIEMGPGSGHLGGEVIFSGSTDQFWHSKTSVTVPFFSKINFDASENRNHRPVDLANYKYKITLHEASGHNLKNITVSFPLNRLVVVTGVSGSGKSTLITKTLYPALARCLDVEYTPSQNFKSIEGHEFIKNIVLLDQSPIGRSIRSNCLTYLKIYDHVRNIFANTERAKFNNITAGHFSLNVDGGRCPVCKGMGVEEVEMMFMDNVYLPCEACDGKKFIPEVLDVTFQGKNILDILNMTVEEAMHFFVNFPPLRKSLTFLKEVGLEYLRLGQSSGTLSGGESQRLKIAKELSQVQQKSTLYILDEPTTGLHFREVKMLMKILHRLIDAGSSVIVVEHNTDVIEGADHIIDLGPEGGSGGGEIVFEGSPSEIKNCKKSLTGQFLNQT